MSRTAPAGSPRARRVYLAAILLLALSVRVVYVLQSQANPAFAQPSMDALYHLEWARAFAAGREFQAGPFFRAPLYPWFLGLLIAVLGENVLLLRLVQAAIGTVSVGLVYLVGRRAFDARTGLLAALLSAIYWVTIYFEGEFLLPVLEILLDLLALWLSLRLDEKPTRLRAALAGAAFGTAALVRPNVLLFLPFVILWILLRQSSRAWTPLANRWALPLAFVVGSAAPIAPVTLHNGLVGHDWVLVSSQGGVNFWIGNNPASDGSSAIVPGTRMDWWGGYHDSIRLAEAEAGRKLSPSEVSRHYGRKAWRWIRSEPAAALRHWIFKLRLFWTDWELSNNTSERFFALRYGPVLRFLPLGFTALASLALLGFCLAARDWRRLLPLWGFLPVYTASVVAFFVCSRFRVPVLPVLAIFAAHASFSLLAMLRARAFGRLALSAGFLALAAAFVGRVPAAIDRSDSNGYWQLGQIASQRGDEAAAVECYQAAIAARPETNAMLHADLADALRRQGRLREAEEAFRRAIAIDPANQVALSRLCDLLLASGRRDEALRIARQAVERSRISATARYDLGRVLYLEGLDLKRSGAAPNDADARFQEALAQLQRGEELASDPPTTFRCAYAGGRTRRELGLEGEAVAAFERALAAVPEPPGSVRPEEDAWWWQCQGELLGTLASMERIQEAKARRNELGRRFPGDPRVARLPNPGGP